jgi:hypothetical protein
VKVSKKSSAQKKLMKLWCRYFWTVR